VVINVLIDLLIFIFHSKGGTYIESTQIKKPQKEYYNVNAIKHPTVETTEGYMARSLYFKSLSLQGFEKFNILSNKDQVVF
jgi:hypothetical protein